MAPLKLCSHVLGYEPFNAFAAKFGADLATAVSLPLEDIFSAEWLGLHGSVVEIKAQSCGKTRASSISLCVVC